MKMKLSKIISLLILGIAIIVITSIVETKTAENSFRAGIFTGIGSGLIIIAIISFIMIVWYKKRPEELKKYQTMSTEERRVMIKEKAGLMAFSTGSFISSIIIMILAALNAKMEIILLVCGGMILNSLIFVFMMYYYDKKY